MPRPTRWKGCVNGLKGRVRACFICPPIRLTSTPSKWPAPKLSSSCARLKRALWKHSMRRLLRPYKLFLRAMLKASSSMSDSVYDPYGNRYIYFLGRPLWIFTEVLCGPEVDRSSCSVDCSSCWRWLAHPSAARTTHCICDPTLTRTSRASGLCNGHGGGEHHGP